MKNKFKTVKLFSGAAVMATLCLMASGVGATRAPEGNNTRSVAYYEERYKQACAARRRINTAYEDEMNIADGQWEKAQKAEYQAPMSLIVEILSKSSPRVAKYEETRNRIMQAPIAEMAAIKNRIMEAYIAKMQAPERQLGELFRVQIEAELKDMGRQWEEAYEAHMLASKERWLEAHGTEMENIYRQCDESYSAMIDAKFRGYNVENSMSYRFFKQKGLTTMNEIVPIVTEAGKNIGFVFNSYQTRNQSFMHDTLDRNWLDLYSLICRQLAKQPSAPEVKAK